MTTTEAVSGDITDVAAGRVQLDTIDEQIRSLVLARRQVSQQVQQLRRAAGGPRIEHSRENEILARYSAALGRPGVSLALAVLELCRGQVPGQ
ncbi:MAG TPA: chorismate mutase [Mycobacteriales bacterium]|nr:chorismate mutase [Mycobacteriales bacterium]